MKTALLPALVVVVLTGCSSAPPADNRAAALKQVKAADDGVIAAFAKRDAAQMAAAYAADAALMINNSKLMKGDEVQAALKALATDPNFSMSLDTQKVEAAKSGELGYTRGAYVLTVTDPTTKKVVKEVGKFLTVYAKQPNGSWKIVDDAATPDEPAAFAETKK